jgi:hypothetical protein
VVILPVLLFRGKSDPGIDENNPDVPIEFNEQQVPLDHSSTKVSAGDVVVVNVHANMMDDVYGYQFNMNYFTDYLEYNGHIYSDIEELVTIFATEKEQNLLIGATMIGDAKGYSGQEVPVCHLEFIALSDIEMEPDFDIMKYITLSRVNVVKDDLQYFENVTGWTATISVQ